MCHWGKAMTWYRPMVDRPALDAQLPQMDNALPKPLDAGRHRGRLHDRQRGRQRRLERRRIRQRPGEELVRRRPRSVFADGLTTDVQVPGDAPVPLAELEPANDFSNVQHVRSPSCHARPSPTRQRRLNQLAIGLALIAARRIPFEKTRRNAPYCGLCHAGCVMARACRLGRDLGNPFRLEAITTWH
jgi:hypothetical protein